MNGRKTPPLLHPRVAPNREIKLQKKRNAPILVTMEPFVESISEPGYGARRLRLSTLINTRWLAVLGQASAIGIVFGYLKFPVPIMPCILLITASVVLNMVLTWQYPANQRLEPPAVFAVLMFDVLQLTGLLYFTGGLENPFSILLVVPVVISAVSAPRGYTVALGGVVIAAASLLVFSHAPLPWYAGVALEVPFMYLAGFWTAVVVSLAFSAFYISRVADEARKLTDALAAAELVLQREMHLSALDGLAAAAAHELGTPLATISLVAKEMDREVKGPASLREDIVLLRTQADRCREILSRLSTLQTTSEKQMVRLPVTSMIEEVIAPHREFGVDITASKAYCIGPEPITRRNPGIIYGLGNIVENAVDFASTKASVIASWDEHQLIIEVTDDGPGFSVEHLERLGEPDVRNQPGAERQRKGSTGLGLGVFIAKTLLERTGATLRFANHTMGKGGARVSVSWQRKSIDGDWTYSQQEERELDDARSTA